MMDMPSFFLVIFFILCKLTKQLEDHNTEVYACGSFLTRVCRMWSMVVILVGPSVLISVRTSIRLFSSLVIILLHELRALFGINSRHHKEKNPEYDAG